MAPVASSPAPTVKMIREPKGVEAIRRIGAGANIKSVSTARCELVLSGSLEGFLGLAIALIFLLTPQLSNDTRSLVGDRPPRKQGHLECWKRVCRTGHGTPSRSPPQGGGFFANLAKNSAVLLFLESKLCI
jgi:hypothetical protein